MIQKSQMRRMCATDRDKAINIRSSTRSSPKSSERLTPGSSSQRVDSIRVGLDVDVPLTPVWGEVESHYQDEIAVDQD
jgi:hypothetical protein